MKRRAVKVKPPRYPGDIEQAIREADAWGTVGYRMLAPVRGHAFETPRWGQCPVGEA